MHMIQIRINGQPIGAAEGSTILQAAKQAGIQIPTLCFLEKRDPIGACRVCLVEVEGARTLMAACSTPCTEGMVVRVNSPKARAMRKQVVELLLSEHDGDCQTCERNEDCELKRLASDMGIREVPYPGARAAAHIDGRRRGWCATTPSASSAAAASRSARRPRASARCSRRGADFRR
jgi:NADP-reducing hydrogenase subunit HndD